MNVILGKIALGLSLVLLGATQVNAQLQLKPKGKEFLNKSDKIINEVLTSLGDIPPKKSKGDFARSVAQQRQAVKYYRLQDYKNAIYHSNYARELAFKVWMHRNRKFKPQWALDKLEESIVAQAPSLKTMDELVEKENPGIQYLDDPYYQDKKVVGLNVE